MKLVSISVENFRSITKAPKIRIGRSTTLVGPNNEGKSNILLALATAMKALTGERGVYRDAQGARIVRRLSDRWYSWDRDFPLHIQASKPEGKSVITLEFELRADEIALFKNEIRSNLNGTLPIRVALGKSGQPMITVAKQGKGSKTLSAKSSQIAAFVAQRLEFEYIPAVRTAESSEEIVRGLVERELQTLEDDAEYQEALAKVAALQNPILAELSNNIKSTLIKFLPDVTEVAVSIRSADRYKALRTNCEIYIDDGRRTALQFKGDGVQSLAALAIMRHASERGASGRSLVIAIEEPESHLHPSAIHDLYGVLRELSEKHQVVITTHCPLFVDRVHVRNNVIVHKHKAKPADTIDQVRAILGVRASDNLRHAELVLLVEGADDKIALAGLLPKASSFLAGALTSGTLVIDPVGGAGNLSYKASLVREALCSVHVLVDSDAAGLAAFEKAENEAVLSLGEMNVINVPGLKEAEFEDMFDPAVYKAMIWNKYKVTLDSPKFRSDKKWSGRMRDVFIQQGKPWNDGIESAAKLAVAAMGAATEGALHPQRRSSFDALVAALESRLTGLREAAEE